MFSQYYLKEFNSEGGRKGGREVEGRGRSKVLKGWGESQYTNTFMCTCTCIRAYDSGRSMDNFPSISLCVCAFELTFCWNNFHKIYVAYSPYHARFLARAMVHIRLKCLSRVATVSLYMYSRRQNKVYTTLA